jgi:hypothetical protein
MPEDVFTPWPQAQRVVDHLAHERPPAASLLRTIDLLEPDRAARIAAWFAGPPPAASVTVRLAYRALERDTARLYAAVRGLGIRITYVDADDDDPYATGAALCADLRRHRAMEMRSIACDAPHPLLGGERGGPVDQLRVVHDVLGHAALGLGFDLQSEYATWLQCRTLFSPAARGAAFTELVGAVTAYVHAGDKPALRADLPPSELIAPTASTGAPGPRPARVGSPAASPAEDAAPRRPRRSGRERAAR